MTVYFSRKNVQPCACQPAGRAVPVLGAGAVLDLKSRMRQGPPHACFASPGQAAAWQAESAYEAPTLPEALSVEPQ